MTGRIGWARPPLPGQPTLLCLPYAGGDGTAFRSWQARLGDRCTVAWAELPGRGGHFRLPPLRSVAAQVDWLLDEVRAIAPPLVIFGHSMGALTGFELAHALRASGNLGNRGTHCAPALLMAAGHQPPGQGRDEPALHALPEPELVRHLAAIDGTPAGVLEHMELLQLLTPRLRADFEACETYQPQPRAPLDMPLVAYGGAQDGDVPPAALLHWAPLTRGRFDCVLLPGKHFFLQSAEDLLLRDVASRLPR